MLSKYKFSSTAQDIAPEILNGKSEEDFLRSKYIHSACVFGLRELQQSGHYRIAGWSFDFRPWLKRYVVLQYGSWQSYYAPNKTMLRKTIFGKINHIQEITTKRKAV